MKNKHRKNILSQVKGYRFGRSTKERVAKERAYFEDAKNVAAFLAARKQNDADAKFCWK